VAITRVYILAGELGVKSGAIIEKCQAEGLDVKNHMSTISAGLAATIREWFTEGQSTTAIETAAPVDLRKVRVRKKKPKPAAATKKDAAPEQPAPAGPAEQPAQITLEPISLSPSAAVSATLQVAPPVPPQPVAADQAAPSEAVPAATIALPVEPEPIRPAGPILEKPSPAKLTGPDIVRIEAPEPVKRLAVRPKPQKQKRDIIPTEPLICTDEQDLASSKILKGKKVTITHGRRREPLDPDSEKRPRALRKPRERDMQERRARLEAAGAERLRVRPSRKILTARPAEAVLRPRSAKITITEPITVKDLSTAIGVKTSEIITILMRQATVATVNQVISTEAAELVAMEFGVELQIEHKQSCQEQIEQQFRTRQRNNLCKRCPVVTMLGHVDHGKTSLLDRIRSTNVVASEAGGITQHIGAYRVEWDGKAVTFLDTPGHEAFTSMRARGANMTDIVVLVVAADDGVMPQTVEAINHARAAGVPIIVALNKIDLPGIDLNRVFGQLADHNLAPAQWGGQTEVVKTSAVTGEGIRDLLEHLDYTVELLNLTDDHTIPAAGWVVEAKMTPQQGPIATLLLREGQLRKGDIVLAGAAFGRVRSIRDDRGRDLKAAASSMPVEVAGLNDVPQAGDRFYCLDDINRAKAAAEENKALRRQRCLGQRQRITLDNLFSQIEAGNIKELNLILRADVQGSVDVLVKYLSELSTDEVRTKLLHAAVGGITEGDVLLAQVSGAIIIGFNVVPEDAAARLAESAGVDIRLYNIIYRITEDLRKAMAGLLEPELREQQLGRAVVRNIFKISSIGTVAGAYVTSGLVSKNARFRLIRDNIVLKSDYTLESLKRFKEDVREVKAGLECGMKIAGFDDVKVDDVLEFYQFVEVQRTL
jgi:translation initiation factor IF-2